MITSTIFPARYIQGFNALSILGKELNKLGKKGFIIASPFVNSYILPSVQWIIEKSADFVIEEFHRECTFEEIERLTEAAQINEADVIVGFGGGKTIDTAKLVAHNLELPVIIVPSIASSDAPCSAVSIIYKDNGEFKEAFQLKKNPDLLLVDTQILSEAPSRFLVAGMGDAIATWFEAESCMLGRKLNPKGHHGSHTAFGIAQMCFETVMEYGYSAKVANEQRVATPAFEHVVEANTLLSSLGFENAGLGAAHSIHNGFTVMPQSKEFLHGEKVAFGVLASLFMNDKDTELIDSIYNFYEAVGLPTTLEQIGMGELQDQDFWKIGERTCAEGESIFNEAGGADPEMVIASIKAADGYGKERFLF